MKWATCNIGANKPEEYGNYYGWGEPTGTDVFDDSEPVDKLNKRFPARADRFLPPYSIINTSRDIANYNWGENGGCLQKRSPRTYRQMRDTIS